MSSFANVQAVATMAAAATVRKVERVKAAAGSIAEAVLGGAMSVPVDAAHPDGIMLLTEFSAAVVQCAAWPKGLTAMETDLATRILYRAAKRTLQFADVEHVRKDGTWYRPLAVFQTDYADRSAGWKNDAVAAGMGTVGQTADGQRYFEVDWKATNPVTKALKDARLICGSATALLLGGLEAYQVGKAKAAKATGGKAKLPRGAVKI